MTFHAGRTGTNRRLAIMPARGPIRTALNEASTDQMIAGRPVRDICGMRTAAANRAIAYALVRHGVLGRTVLVCKPSALGSSTERQRRLLVACCVGSTGETATSCPGSCWPPRQ